MAASPKRCTQVLTGSTDKKFKVWESSLASALTTIEFDADIRSVCAARNGSYLVGTRESSIYQVVGGEATLLNEAHHARTGAMGEVWGLATHPSTDELATCGDDGTLRVWSGRQRRLLAKAQLGGLARAVAYHPQGNLLAVGMGGRLGGAEDGPVGECVVMPVCVRDNGRTWLTWRVCVGSVCSLVTD